MSASLDKLRALTSRLENKIGEKKKVSTTVLSIDNINNKIMTIPEFRSVIKLRNRRKNSGDIRDENVARVKELYKKLKIFVKSPDFSNIFIYKAMNLSGISLKEEDFGIARQGKYIQVIAITYEPDKNGRKKAKNISLGYFGKADFLETTLKNEIIEFVLRWRYEKAFQNVEHYRNLIAKVDKPTVTQS